MNKKLICLLLLANVIYAVTCDVTFTYKYGKCPRTVTETKPTNHPNCDSNCNGSATVNTTCNECKD